MKKEILNIGLVTALSTSLLGFTYEIKDGWQQLGAIEDIEDMTIFNNAGCVDHVWYYDNNKTTPEWKLHIADGNTYNYCGETLDSLKKGQGFWVKATGNCTIEIDEPSCNSFGMPVPPSPDSCDLNITNPDNNQTTLETVTHNSFTYEEVLSPHTGKIWLDRNLGASQACTEINDSLCFGDYYQWGRGTDGHEKLNSATTTVKATSISNGGNKFIITPYPQDWTTGDSDGMLRSAYWSKTDGSSICPIGYRVPTIEELTAELFDPVINKHGLEQVFNSFLKIASSSQRDRDTGSLKLQQAPLWSSSIGTQSSQIGQAFRSATSISAAIGSNPSGNGFPVRCIKD